MLKGTRIITGKEANEFSDVIYSLRRTMKYNGFEEVIVPAIWEQQTFIDKAGPEIISQMWAFNDKSDREVCLIPEVTAIIQQEWRDHWCKEMKNRKIFYVSRCYRYEKPQAGRYREFTQFGMEMLGTFSNAEVEAREMLKICLYGFSKLKWEFKDSVRRGLSYYVDDGFEVEVASLGAQKQIAGGGRYTEGIGWAIGIDRLMLALSSN